MIRWHGARTTARVSTWRVGGAAVLALLCLAWNGAPSHASTTFLQAQLAAVGAVRGDGSAAELVAHVQCSALAEVDIQLTVLQVASDQQLAGGSGDLRTRCARGSHAFKVPLVGDRRFKTGEVAATLRVICVGPQSCAPATSERVLSLHAGVNFDRPMSTSPDNASLSAALRYSANLLRQGTRVLATARLTCRKDVSSVQALLTQTTADGSVHTEFTDLGAQCTGVPHHTTVAFKALTSPFHPGAAFLQLTGSDCTKLDRGGDCSSVLTWREVALT